jgi:hypothetical protein
LDVLKLDVRETGVPSEECDEWDTTWRRVVVNAFVAQLV